MSNRAEQLYIGAIAIMPDAADRMNDVEVLAARLQLSVAQLYELLKLSDIIEETTE